MDIENRVALNHPSEGIKLSLWKIVNRAMPLRVKCEEVWSIISLLFGCHRHGDRKAK